MLLLGEAGQSVQAISVLFITIHVNLQRFQNFNNNNKGYSDAVCPLERDGAGLIRDWRVSAGAFSPRLSQAAW